MCDKRGTESDLGSVETLSEVLFCVFAPERLAISLPIAGFPGLRQHAWKPLLHKITVRLGSPESSIGATVSGGKTLELSSNWSNCSVVVLSASINGSLRQPHSAETDRLDYTPHPADEKTHPTNISGVGGGSTLSSFIRSLNSPVPKGIGIPMMMHWRRRVARGGRERERAGWVNLKLVVTSACHPRTRRVGLI